MPDCHPAGAISSASCSSLLHRMTVLIPAGGNCGAESAAITSRVQTRALICQRAMDLARIAEWLQPFLAAEALPASATLSSEQLQSISIYIELLLRWNAHINLTAVRDPEHIVSRHFGESLFLAAYLFPFGSRPAPSALAPPHALDLGSGAGFPGVPLKIYLPELRLTLVESNRKKSVFLAETIRALGWSGATVFSGHLDSSLIAQVQGGAPQAIAPPNLVTMRAVERFETALQTAGSLVRAGAAELGAGKLALLVGDRQVQSATRLVADFAWETPVPVPQSRSRVLLIGRYPRE